MNIVMYSFALLLLISAYLAGGYLVSFHKTHFLTGYGVLTILWYVSQTVFAYLNYKKTLNLPFLLPYSSESVSIHVVGYRENPDYFRDCLKSCDNILYEGLRLIIIVIDGNEPEDMFMKDIALEIFGKYCTHINMDFLLSDLSSIEREDYINKHIKSLNTRVLIITQIHDGKRNALYTAISITNSMKIPYFFNTDSDTILNKDILTHLMRKMNSEENVGAVGGTLEIFNTNSFISRLSNARYYFAFNVERAAQSYHGCVSCLSGPNSFYKTEIIASILDSWLNETFLGIPAVSGDDRALTFHVLRQGYRVTFTHLAIAITETPEGYLRFISQQLRWIKSNWRYSLLSIEWASTHPMYMRAELSYQLVFPIFLMATLISTIFKRSWFSLELIIFFIFLIPFIRIFIVYKLFKAPLKDLMWYFCYPILFITTLIPLKIYGVFTLADISWGTSNRFSMVPANKQPLIPIFIWWFIIISGLYYHHIVLKAI
jgi:hyaluronan synthase